MTELFLVRHPETELNVGRHLIAGRSEAAPITKRGEEQARRFALAFSEHYPQPDALYSSPTVRTTSLLEIYNHTLGTQKSFTIDANLHEMSQGINEGKDRSDVYTPEVLALIKEQLLDFSFEGGESLNNTADRGNSFLERITEENPDQTVLAATHGQFIRALIGRHLGWNHYETTLDPAHYTDNVSLTHLTLDSGQVKINFYGKDIIEPVENDTVKVY